MGARRLWEAALVKTGNFRKYNKRFVSATYNMKLLRIGVCDERACSGHINLQPQQK